VHGRADRLNRVGRLRGLAAAGLVAALAFSSAPAAQADALEPLVAGLASTLAPEAAAALAAIDGVERRLLAARSYLRAGPDLAERWSWSAARIAEYEQSPEYRDALAELAKVVAAFEAANPGYTLYVNREVRSLDAQIARWNENASVAAVAAELAAAARAQAGGAADAAAVARLREFVVAWHATSVPPAVAAPGLSPHGQGLAFDFQVQQGDRIIAGTDAATAAADWDAAGWTAKLRAAIDGASTHFEGPLAMPPEPWHYEYRP
jgi:hypothetical protein